MKETKSISESFRGEMNKLGYPGVESVDLITYFLCTCKKNLMNVFNSTERNIKFLDKQVLVFFTKSFVLIFILNNLFGALAIPMFRLFFIFEVFIFLVLVKINGQINKLRTIRRLCYIIILIIFCFYGISSKLLFVELQISDSYYFILLSVVIYLTTILKSLLSMDDVKKYAVPFSSILSNIIGEYETNAIIDNLINFLMFDNVMIFEMFLMIVLSVVIVFLIKVLLYKWHIFDIRSLLIVLIVPTLSFLAVFVFCMLSLMIIRNTMTPVIEHLLLDSSYLAGYIRSAVLFVVCITINSIFKIFNKHLKHTESY